MFLLTNAAALPTFCNASPQDDEAELLAELERIKRERAEEAARKASAAVLCGAPGTRGLLTCIACSAGGSRGAVMLTLASLTV